MGLWQKVFGGGEHTPPPRPAAPPPEPLRMTEISPQQLHTRLQAGDAVLVIDLRQESAYHAGHIPGARSLFIQDVPARLHELPTDVDLVLQCWHGHTSLDVADFMMQHGWPAIRLASLRRV